MLPKCINITQLFLGFLGGWGRDGWLVLPHFFSIHTPPLPRLSNPC